MLDGMFNIKCVSSGRTRRPDRSSSRRYVLFHSSQNNQTQNLPTSSFPRHQTHAGTPLYTEQKNTQDVETLKPIVLAAKCDGDAWGAAPKSVQHEKALGEKRKETHADKQNTGISSKGGGRNRISGGRSNDNLTCDGTGDRRGRVDNIGNSIAAEADKPHGRSGLSSTKTIEQTAKVVTEALSKFPQVEDSGSDWDAGMGDDSEDVDTSVALDNQNNLKNKVQADNITEKQPKLVPISSKLKTGIFQNRSISQLHMILKGSG